MCNEPVAGKSPLALIRMVSAPMTWSAAAATIPPFTAPLGLGVSVERSMRKVADAGFNSTHTSPMSWQNGSALAHASQSTVSPGAGYHHAVWDAIWLSCIVSSSFLASSLCHVNDRSDTIVVAETGC